jgi:hypothetical protein
MKTDAAKSGHETTIQAYPQMLSNNVGGRVSGNENQRTIKPAAKTVTLKATARNLTTLNVGDVVMWPNS